MPVRRHWPIAWLVLFLAVSMQPSRASAAPVAFVIDDGTSDIAFGNFSGVTASLLVTNQFDAGPGGATITEVRYVFGTDGGPPTAAVPLQVVIFEDNDDDGSIDDATLLATVDDVPTNIDNDVFNIVAVPPTFVVGRFFIGVFAAGLDDGQALVGSDSNDPPGPTSVYAGTALDLGNVLATADVFAFEPDFTAIALIRGFGVTGAISEPAMPLVLGLTVAGLLLARRSVRTR